jgi:hypothetical protein
MTPQQKDALILAIVNSFDGAEWDAELCSDTAEMLSNRGFKIDDPNEPCPVCDDSMLVLDPVSGEPDDCPKCC